MIDFQKLVETSHERSKRWHNGNPNEWSLLEWAGAMAGEAGEACNAAKKLKRLECGVKSINEAERNYTDLASAKSKTAVEACDTILYAVMVITAAGFSPYEAQEILRDTFNRKSAEYQFPERI